MGSPVWVGSVLVVAMLVASPSGAVEDPPPEPRGGERVEHHLDVRFSVDPVGSVDREGAVTLRGTLTCDWVREDRLETMVSPQISVQQSVGAAHASIRHDNVPLPDGRDFSDSCEDYAVWGATVRSETGDPFRPGPASVEMSAWLEYVWPGRCDDDPPDFPADGCGWGSLVSEHFEVTLHGVEPAPPPAEPSSATEASTDDEDAGVSVSRPTRIDTGAGGTAPRSSG
jgi:hypothetical protein